MYLGMTMRSIGFHNFQQCCFRLPDRWSNSTHWMGRLFLAFFFITMTSKWARWRLKSPVSRLFTQPFIQAQIKENIKAPRHWPLWGEFTDDRWIPPQRASDAENVSIWWRHHVMIHLDSLCLMIPLAGPSPKLCPQLLRKWACSSGTN